MLEERIGGARNILRRDGDEVVVHGQLFQPVVVSDHRPNNKGAEARPSDFPKLRLVSS